MKKQIFAVAIAIAAVVTTVAAAISVNNEAEAAIENAPTIVQYEYFYDGAFFSSANVVDIFWYGTSDDGVYYITYDDADADFYYEVIRVDEASYKLIVDAIENDCVIYGEFFAMYADDAAVTYSIIPDNE